MKQELILMFVLCFCIYFYLCAVVFTYNFSMQSFKGNNIFIFLIVAVAWPLILSADLYVYIKEEKQHD
jgi:hypothetical protein